jgi:hypothetical protein
MKAGFDSIRPFSRLHSWGERRQRAGLFAYSPQKYCRDRLTGGANRIRTFGPAVKKERLFGATPWVWARLYRRVRANSERDQKTLYGGGRGGNGNFVASFNNGVP